MHFYAYGNISDDPHSLPLVNDENNNENPNKPKIQANESNSGEQILTKSKILSFIICFTGLQVSFLLWGIMQERIVKFGYVTADLNQIDKEKLANFKNSQFLVLTNRFAGLVLSSIILFACNRKSFRLGGVPSSFKKMVSNKNWGPLFRCSYSSLSNVLSSWFQYESLKYVSFTTQLLAKSSKSVFVMLTGKVISNKKYKLNEYFSVCLIAFGIFLFSDFHKNDLHKTNKMIQTSLPGILCLLGYLVSDSFTSTWQDSLIKNYSMSSISLMFITNVYSCLFTLVSLISQDELSQSIKFLTEYSDIGYHVFLLSLTSAIGQIFIFVTIQKFGALVFSLIMTTRQVLSIVLSSIIFSHSLSVQSIIGIGIIFFALFFQQFYKINFSKLFIKLNSQVKNLRRETV